MEMVVQCTFANMKLYDSDPLEAPRRALCANRALLRQIRYAAYGGEIGGWLENLERALGEVDVVSVRNVKRQKGEIRHAFTGTGDKR